MSEKTIWDSLRSSGLSEAGTAGMMGNMYCESLLKSNNVQDGMGYSDEEYVRIVNNRSYSKDQFCKDSKGFGLCQWTFWSRKQLLYEMTVEKGISVDDEATQCNLAIKELKDSYPCLYSYLCNTTDVYTSASRICCEYEQPAVNNIQPRANKAQEYYNKYKGSSVDSVSNVQTISNTASTSGSTSGLSINGIGSSWIPSTNQSTDSCTVQLRCLRSGDSGNDVYMLQTALNRKGTVSCGVVDGKYGGMTLAAVNALKSTMGISQDTEGYVGEDILQYLYS